MSEVDKLEESNPYEKHNKEVKTDVKINEAHNHESNMDNDELLGMAHNQLGTDIERQPSELNLSYCGCGFLGIYHVGVATSFLEYAPQLMVNKISGVSAGSIVAVAHVCGNLQLAYAVTAFLDVAIDARSRALGPFHPAFDMNASVREALERYLPDDIHLRVNGRLHISLTRVHDGENIIINEFDSKEDVVQAVLCSCFIPFWTGIVPPKYKGVSYIDGGFSNNLVILDDKTITVSPFAGEADICPQDGGCGLIQFCFSNTSMCLSSENIDRLTHALLPSPPEYLSQICERGFADGIRFLQQQNLISCKRCLDIHSTSIYSDWDELMAQQEYSDDIRYSYASEAGEHEIILERSEHTRIEVRARTDSLMSSSSQATDTSSCDECILIRQKALEDPLPYQFTERIRDACDAVNRGFSNWIYSHKALKYLLYMAAPYYLPVDLSLGILYRCFWRQIPSIKGFIMQLINEFMEAFIQLIKDIERPIKALKSSTKSKRRHRTKKICFTYDSSYVMFIKFNTKTQK